MHHRWMLSIAALTISVAISAQTNTSSTPQVTLKAQALTVVVDVVVTDHHGNPINNLTKDQFHLLENGTPQEIKFFEEHHQIDPSQVKQLPPLPENIYTNFPTRPLSDSVNIVLMDALNTPMTDQLHVRQQMVAYLKQIPPGTQLAIFTLGSRLQLLQGFSSDPKILLAALNSKKTSASRSPLLTESGDTTLDEQVQEAGGRNDYGFSGDGDLDVSEVARQLQQFETDVQAFQTDMQVQYTLEAFQQLGAYLSGLPGRKNVIWFSGAFPIGIAPNGDLQAPGMGAFQNPNSFRVYADKLRKIADMLAVNQIAIYPVDARGLMVPSMVDASQSGTKYYKSDKALTQENAKKFQQTTAEHATMGQLAEDTGGQAIYNTNGLKEALAEVIHSGSSYYTIAYTPVDNKYDGRYRKIAVQVNPPNAKLAYRHGYFADDPNAPQPNAVSSGDYLQTAMRRGAPDATEILFKVQVFPAESQPDFSKESLRKSMNSANLKGSLVRYSIDWAIDIHDLRFTKSPEGLQQGSLLISMIGYDADGKSLNSETKSLRLSLPPKIYADASQRGLRYHQELDLPRGEAFLHLGVFDQENSKTGAMEIHLLPPKSSRPKPTVSN